MDYTNTNDWLLSFAQKNIKAPLEVFYNSDTNEVLIDNWGLIVRNCFKKARESAPTLPLVFEGRNKKEPFSKRSNFKGSNRSTTTSHKGEPVIKWLDNGKAWKAAWVSRAKTTSINKRHGSPPRTPKLRPFPSALRIHSIKVNPENSDSHFTVELEINDLALVKFRIAFEPNESDGMEPILLAPRSTDGALVGFLNQTTYGSFQAAVFDAVVKHATERGWGLRQYGEWCFTLQELALMYPLGSRLPAKALVLVPGTKAGFMRIEPAPAYVPASEFSFHVTYSEAVEEDQEESFNHTRSAFRSTNPKGIDLETDSLDRSSSQHNLPNDFITRDAEGNPDPEYAALDHWQYQTYLQTKNDPAFISKQQEGRAMIQNMRSAFAGWMKEDEAAAKAIDKEFKKYLKEVNKD